MNKNAIITIIFIINLVSCADISSYRQEWISPLYQGMSKNEVRAIYGQPNSITYSNSGATIISNGKVQNPNKLEHWHYSKRKPINADTPGFINLEVDFDNSGRVIGW